MRRVILGAGITLDGCIARPDGSVDYLHMTKEGAKDFGDFFKTIDTIVMGRKTLEAVIDHERRLLQISNRSPHLRLFSRPTARRAGWRHLHQTVPSGLAGKIRARPGKHIFHMGGGELARSFLQADLIDELYLGIVPILLGRGIPFFPSGFPQRDFTLVRIRLTRRAKSR